VAAFAAAERAAPSRPEYPAGLRRNPHVWVSDRYAGQQELGSRHQVCLVRDHIRWAIRVGKRRRQLKDTLIAAPVAHPAGKTLLKKIKAWRTKFFVFMTDPDVPATNNISEREIRPSAIFRKVIGGFRSDWGAQIHAGYRSVTGTARINGKQAIDAIRDLIDGKFAVA